MRDAMRCDAMCTALMTTAKACCVCEYSMNACIHLCGCGEDTTTSTTVTTTTVGRHQCYHFPSHRHAAIAVAVAGECIRIWVKREARGSELVGCALVCYGFVEVELER